MSRRSIHWQSSDQAGAWRRPVFQQPVKRGVAQRRNRQQCVSPTNYNTARCDVNRTCIIEKIDQTLFTYGSWKQDSPTWSFWLNIRSYFCPGLARFTSQTYHATNRGATSGRISVWRVALPESVKKTLFKIFHNILNITFKAHKVNLCVVAHSYEV